MLNTFNTVLSYLSGCNSCQSLSYLTTLLSPNTSLHCTGLALATNTHPPSLRRSSPVPQKPLLPRCHQGLPEETALRDATVELLPSDYINNPPRASPPRRSTLTQLSQHPYFTDKLLLYCSYPNVPTLLFLHSTMSDAGAGPAVDPAAARKEQQAQDLAKAKAAGWADPVPFEYGNTTGEDSAEDETRENVPWLSDAAIYQWDDDFGDVGDPNPELEKMLFSNEYQQRAGNAINALSFEVSVEGPEKLMPVRNVSDPDCVFLVSFY